MSRHFSPARRRPTSGMRAKDCARRRRRMWSLEALEDRVLLSDPTVYTVTDTNDMAGDTGSLRYCIDQANANSDSAGSLIQFDPIVFATAQTITLDPSLGTLDLTESSGPEIIEGPGSSLVTIDGALQVANGVSATVSGLTILGGGIGNSGTTTVSDSMISGGDHGIDNDGTMTIVNSIINNNGYGVSNSAALAITGSTVAFNSVRGIVNSQSGVLTVTNSTIAHNSGFAILGGGGGGIENGGRLTAVNDTIAYNIDTGGEGGGLYDAAGSTAALQNTIVAQNGVFDIAGAALSSTSTYNLVGVDESGSLTDGENGNQVGVKNPHLGPLLASNGGPTWTIGLLPGSPAIDAGNNALAIDPTSGLALTDDQRGAGFPRIVNDVVDIGASESLVVPGSPTLYTVDRTTDDGPTEAGSGSGTTGDLRYVINKADADPNPAGSEIQFDPTVFAQSETITLSPGLGTLILSESAGPELIQGPGAGMLTISGGGAVAVFQVSGNVTTISDLTISGGSAFQHGGGISAAGILTITRCTIKDNVGGGTSSAAGGVWFSGSRLSITDSTIEQNSGRAGGGIYVRFGSLTIADSAIMNNSGYGATGAGGINDMASTVMIKGSTISNNSGTSGGGIFVGGSALWLTLVDSTIANNRSASGGGGVGDYNPGLAATMIEDCTIANNFGTSGGGIFESGELTVAHSTIADNQGGGLYVNRDNNVFPFPAAHLYNTIVDLNTDFAGGDDIAGELGIGASSDSAYNLVGVDATGTLTDGVNGNQVGISNPGLGPLAANGGLTQTMALMPGSPAIDAGSSDAPGITVPGRDQRGLNRIVNGTVDIGAFEAQQETTTTTVTASPAASVSGQSVTFMATVTPQAGSAIPIATGAIQFQVDGSDLGGPVAIVNGIATSGAISSLSVASHTISAVYTSASTDFVAGSGSTSITVEDSTVSNIQSVVNDAPSSSGGSVTIQTTSSSAVSSAVQAVNSATPVGTVTVTLDLGGTTTTPTTAISAPDSVQINFTSTSGGATVQGATVSAGTVFIAASVSPVNWTVNGGNVIVQGGAAAGDFVVNGGTVTLADGTVITGNSPAIIVNAGTVILQGVTARTATDSPTVIVNGGSLMVRDSTIEESTGSAQAAIQINGGSVDLGTSFSPGGNIFNVNGTGTLIANLTAVPVSAVGDTFENNGAAVPSGFGVMSLSAPAAQSANQGVPRDFSPGSLTDTVNDSQSWAVDINWGDGSAHTDFNAASTGSLSAQSHAFALPGTYTVAVTTIDLLASGVMEWDLIQTFTVTVTPSVFVLNPTTAGALTLSGYASLTIPGAIVVDSNSRTALSAAGNAQVTGSVIDVAGGVQTSGNATLHPGATTGISSLADPLAGLVSPSTTGLTNYGALSLSGNSSRTIGPGIYSQITASGNAVLTMNAGLYLIEGGGFTVTGNASVAGSGVTIYNAGSNYPNSGGTFGGITLSGSGSFNLTAPTSGMYAGILIFQSRQNTRALSFSGNAMGGLTGVIYAQNALLSMSGNASLQNPLDVGMLNLSGNVALTQIAAGSDGSGDTVGIANTLRAGNLSVYINDPSGLFTPDELARIQDAIDAWDAILAPYSVTITEVSDPTQANLVIDTGTTSASGGAAQGVLGCYNAPDAEITILQGWNWYAGADPGGIGADQYDFETTTIHELGHALGLGHSTDPSSPMYATLSTGVADRTPTTQDLNIPDPPDGADPQMAAGFLPVSAAMPSSLNPRAAAPVAVAIPGPAGLMPLTPASGPWSVIHGQWPVVGVQTSSEATFEPTIILLGSDRENEREPPLIGPDAGRVLDVILADLVTDADRGGGEEAVGTSGVRDLPEAGDGTAPGPIPSDRIDPTDFGHPVGLPLPVRPVERGLIGMDGLSDTVLDELAAEAVGWPGRAAVPTGSMARPATLQEPGGGLTRLAAALIVAGSWGYRVRFRGATRRLAGSPRHAKEPRVV